MKQSKERRRGSRTVWAGLNMWPRNEKGMALLTVLIFGLIFVIGTLAFFAVAGYESGQAQIRNDSMRAFYLADGAIELAKRELLVNARWDDGFPPTSLDGGQYEMEVTDTTYLGQTRKRFYAEGYYRRTKRDVEVIANIRPTAPDLAIHANGDIDVTGNVCLDGFAHANGECIDPEHFRCGSERIYTYDCGYDVTPPAIYTDPDSFPTMTYYFVTVTGPPVPTLFILDRDRNPIGAWVTGTSPHPDITWSYDNGPKKLTVDVQPTTAFDQVTGPFPRLGGDVSVIINFAGEPTGDHQVTDMQLHETGAFEIQSTIINTYFTGSSLGDRTDKEFWVGGRIECMSKTFFAPLACIAIIGKEIWGNAQVNLGTMAHPALTYMMGDVDFSVGQWTITGTLISLGNIQVGGGVNLNYNSGFISCLPPSLRDNWPVGTSGTMEVLLWREPPTRS